jgi:hypothetical protein
MKINFKIILPSVLLSGSRYLIVSTVGTKRTLMHISLYVDLLLLIAVSKQSKPVVIKETKKLIYYRGIRQDGDG